MKKTIIALVIVTVLLMPINLHFFNAPETTKRFAYIKAIQEFLIKNRFIQRDVYIQRPELGKRKHLRLWHSGSYGEFKEISKRIQYEYRNNSDVFDTVDGDDLFQ